MNVAGTLLIIVKNDFFNDTVNDNFNRDKTSVISFNVPSYLYFY